jgi:hypothetical protein
MLSALFVLFTPFLGTALAAPSLPHLERAIDTTALLYNLVQADDVVVTPIPPKDDPWYAAPDGYESAAPGAILKMRAAPGDVQSVFGIVESSYNILYRTTDSRDAPSWAVTTMLVPSNATGSLLSYQVPYDSADLNASPSYSLATLTPRNEASLSSNIQEIREALRSGWYVTVPDYEGPLASCECPQWFDRC